MSLICKDLDMEIFMLLPVKTAIKFASLNKECNKLFYEERYWEKQTNLFFPENKKPFSVKWKDYFQGECINKQEAIKKFPYKLKSKKDAWKPSDCTWGEWLQQLINEKMVVTKYKDKKEIITLFKENNMCMDLKGNGDNGKTYILRELGYFVDRYYIPPSFPNANGVLWRIIENGIVLSKHCVIEDNDIYLKESVIFAGVWDSKIQEYV